MWLKYVPNALSVMRLVFAGAFPFAPADWRWLLIAAAGFSDVADGFLARRYNLISRIGSVLDAAADKLFVLSVLVTLSWVQVIALWQIVPLLSRDLVVALIAVYTAGRRKWRAFGHMPPRPLGKATTIVVFAYLLFITMLPGYESTREALFILATACSALAGVDYFIQFLARKEIVEQRIESTTAVNTVNE